MRPRSREVVLPMKLTAQQSLCAHALPSTSSILDLPESSQGLWGRAASHPFCR